MLEHRAAVEQQFVQQEADLFVKFIRQIYSSDGTGTLEAQLSTRSFGSGVSGQEFRVRPNNPHHAEMRG
jgi:hypothetical protein